MYTGDDNVSGSKLQHAKRIASTEDINFTAVAVVGGEDTGETKRLLTKVHGPCVSFLQASLLPTTVSLSISQFFSAKHV